MKWTCHRCDVFKPKEQCNFATNREAFMHAVDCHPHRLADVLASCDGASQCELLDLILDDSHRAKE